MSDPGFGHYHLLQQLPSGETVEAFQARDARAHHRKPMVLSRLAVLLARERAFVETFIGDAHLAVKLRHANVARAAEAGEAGGTWYVAMEAVHGHRLDEVIDRLRKRGQPFPRLVAAHLGAEVGKGVHAVHEAQGEGGRRFRLMYRELGARSVMLGFDGTVKLFDFGTTRERAALGARPLDRSADVWALGALVYGLITGTALEEGAAASLDPKTGVPKAVCAVVNHCLRANPDDRYGTVLEAAQAFESVVQRSGRPAARDLAGTMRELFADEVRSELGTLAKASSSGESSGLSIEASSANPLPADDDAPGNAPRVGRALLLGLAGAVALVATTGFAFRLAPAVPQPIAAASPAPVEVPVPPVEPAAVAPAPEPEPAPTATGTVVLRVKPWAEVYEGETHLGTTPMPPLELSVGEHVLTFKNPALKVKTATVRVAKDRTVTLKVDLKKR